MGKQRKTTLILGEGPTEFYFFNSLCNRFKGIKIKPDSPKHTNLKDLEKKIEEGVEMGYSQIFCVMDMDTKDNKIENDKYIKLKQKYANPISKPKKGVYCEVTFFETHLCTELFFLYYFTYTSRHYANQDALLKDLNKYVEYEKTVDFFKKSKGLHTYFEKHGGSLDIAIENAERSMQEKESGNRDYTYSELGRLMQKLGESI